MFLPLVPTTTRQRKLKRKEQKHNPSSYLRAFLLSSFPNSFSSTHHQFRALFINCFTTHISSTSSSSKDCHTLFTLPSHRLIFKHLTKMFINVAIVFALAALTSAIPGAEDTKTNYFTAIATHSGDHRIHLQQINASGQKFYLIKGTSTDCPQAKEIDCSKCRSQSRTSFRS